MPFHKFLLVPALLGTFVCSASADTFGLGLSVGGSTSAFPAPSQGMLIVDVSGGNFAELSQSSILDQALSLSPGDRIMNTSLLVMSSSSVPGSKLTLIDFGGGELGFNLGLDTANPFDTAVDADWTVGDRIAILWFPDGTSSVGSRFEWFTSTDKEGGTIDFRTPGPGLDPQLIVNLSDNLAPNGSTTDAAYLNNGGTIAAVPEPATILLIVIAPILLRLLRSARARRV